MAEVNSAGPGWAGGNLVLTHEQETQRTLTPSSASGVCPLLSGLQRKLRLKRATLSKGSPGTSNCIWATHQKIPATFRDHLMASWNYKLKAKSQDLIIYMPERCFLYRRELSCTQFSYSTCHTILFCEISISEATRMTPF